MGAVAVTWMVRRFRLRVEEVCRWLWWQHMRKGSCVGDQLCGYVRIGEDRRERIGGGKKKTVFFWMLQAEFCVVGKPD